MTNSKKVVLGGLAIVAILFVGVAISRSSLVGGGASGATHYQKESFLEGLYAGVGRITEITRTGLVNIGALLTTNAGHTFSYTNATSSSVATYTLTASDVAPNGGCYDTISFTKTGAVATTTWTTFAASTGASTFLPNVGDACIIRFEVATSTEANPGLTLAAGTGWQIGTASTTPTGLTINGGQYGIMHVIRKFNTDLAGELTIYKDAH